MPVTDISFLAVFMQGVLSFLSPCVLPLIPAYLSYLTGKTSSAIMEDTAASPLLALNALMFVLGFSTVFVLLGATASALGGFLVKNSNALRIASGIAITAFGIAQTGLLPLSFLQYERRFQINRAPGLFTSVLMGAAFGFGWTPCIGPALAGVLFLAGSSNTLINGIMLLVLYSLGLGIPFILLAIFMRSLWRFYKKLFKYMKWIKLISGIIMAALGILILTGACNTLSQL